MDNSRFIHVDSMDATQEDFIPSYPVMRDTTTSSLVVIWTMPSYSIVKYGSVYTRTGNGESTEKCTEIVY